MAALDLTQFEALTFDCYGTLIDWQHGITDAMLPLLEKLGRPAQADALIRRFGEIERTKQEGKYRSYRDVLGAVSRELLGAGAGDIDCGVLAESIARWPAFPDTVESLERLKKRYRLGIVSNVDRRLFEVATLPKLGVEFDVIVTAEDVRSYKPRPKHFREAKKRLKLDFDKILHVAESRFHDIEPANTLGMSSVHVDRSGGKGSPSGAGAGKADLKVASMAELAEKVERAFGSKGDS